MYRADFFFIHADSLQEQFDSGTFGLRHHVQANEWQECLLRQDEYRKLLRRSSFDNLLKD